jgi:hypothetical protein
MRLAAILLPILSRIPGPRLSPLLAAMLLPMPSPPL